MSDKNAERYTGKQDFRYDEAKEVRSASTSVPLWEANRQVWLTVHVEITFFVVGHHASAYAVTTTEKDGKGHPVNVAKIHLSLYDYNPPGDQKTGQNCSRVEDSLTHIGPGSLGRATATAISEGPSIGPVTATASAI
jgi:hypothetical protein